MKARATEVNIPRPVHYTDGSVSREYESMATPITTKLKSIEPIAELTEAQRRELVGNLAEHLEPKVWQQARFLEDECGKDCKAIKEHSLNKAYRVLAYIEQHYTLVKRKSQITRGLYDGDIQNKRDKTR